MKFEAIYFSRPDYADHVYLRRLKTHCFQTGDFY